MGESREGFCQHVDTSCSAMNTARTCPTFHEDCVGLSHYPNISIADYGSISGSDAMQKELYNRGPIACSIDATPCTHTRAASPQAWSPAPTMWSLWLAGALIPRLASTGL